MSSESKDPDRDIEQNESVDADGTPPARDTSEPQPLTLTLPDGSESVSDAIVTNREMLLEPREHGLATEDSIGHLSEAVETLSDDVEDATRQSEENQSQVTELQELVKRQHEQIDELQSMVTSLAGILGTEVEWETFGDD